MRFEPPDFTRRLQCKLQHRGNPFRIEVGRAELFATGWDSCRQFGLAARGCRLRTAASDADPSQDAMCPIKRNWLWLHQCKYGYDDCCKCAVD